MFAESIALQDFKNMISLMRDSREQNSRETENHSASQDIKRLLWKQKVHYPVQSSLPLVPVFGQMNPFLPPYFLSLPIRFTSQNFKCISHMSSVYCMPHPPNPSQFEHRVVCFSVQNNKLVIMQF
jgi:hypothetical protein